MDKEEFKRKFISKSGKVRAKLLYVAGKELEGFCEETSSISERIYLYINDYHSVPICPMCNTNHLPFISFPKGHKLYCKKCSLIVGREKREKVCEEIYGVKHPMQTKQCQDKLERTSLFRYGTRRPSQNKNISNKIHQTHQNRAPEDKEKTKQKRIDSCNDKYGVPYSVMSDSVKAKAENTKILEYGVANSFQIDWVREKAQKALRDNRESVNEKTINTNITRYGESSPSKVEEFKQKAKETNMRIRGVPYTMMDPKVQKKSKQSNIEKYGYANPAKSDKVKNKISKAKKENSYFRIANWHSDIVEFMFTSEEYIQQTNRNYKFRFKCKKCNCSFRARLSCGNIPKCPKCNPHRISSPERDMRDLLQESGLEVLFNDRAILGGKELDVYIPKRKIAIEFNGAYWHSLKETGYHLDKTIACMEKGIQLIHVFEDEWKRNESEMRVKILRLVGCYNGEISANDCTLIKESDRFSLLSEDGVLLSILVNEGRLSFEYNNELINVIGGETRLVSEYIKYHNPNMLVYELDRSWENREIIKGMGFKLREITPPDYFFTKRHTWERIYPEDSNETHCIENGYFKLWDCGKEIYEWRRED